MKDKFINVRRSNFFFLFTIALTVCGISLIINSFINISSLLSLNDSLNSQKILQLTSKSNLHYDDLIIHYDQTIKEFSTDLIQDKNNDLNNKSTETSLHVNKFDLGTAVLKGAIPIVDLPKLPSELYLIKDVKTKKDKFIISILPIIVQENEKIRAYRNKLLRIKNLLILNKTLNNENQLFLKYLTSEYKINTINKHKIDIIDNLLEKVDEIPNSIVLAQAANESGWGTSRFAKEYNALFGEYTFDINQGVEPKYRNNGERHLIKYFSTINDCVRSYFKNLNTHLAYEDFRRTRAQLRNNNLELDPIILISQLKLYAKDKNYVKTIKSIIRMNKLIQFDNVKYVIINS